ncbi:uncharacterized protein LOC110989390 [Acanthaster planci]|uniref:Uncharacterized protein LOC110989390 n=1 Tax=Acanthaster planci TaxID=133434 RepID=A0A8B7ZV57_ACAPL|nr:uncharacterized protein LOC110989390 [Acanthaster planci]
MLGVLLLYVILLSGVESNWDAGNSDLSEQHLGFSHVNMTCNDAGNVCQHCFTTLFYGQRFLAVTEITREPYKFQFSVHEGNRDRIWYFTQDDPGEEYRWCETPHVEPSEDIPVAYRYTLCFQNIFAGLSIPSGCRRPVAVVTHDSHNYHQEIRGQQILLCLP